MGYMNYEERLEVAKRLYELSNAEQKTALECIFPELKENEDDRIRKELIEHIVKEVGLYPGEDRKEHKWLRWLEKQGEHKKFRDSIQVGDEVTRNSDGVIVNLSQLKRVAKPAQQKLPIEKLPEEMKTIGESLGFTTQEECDEYNQMVSDLIMSDDNMEEQKSNVENKKLTDVNHEYFSELLENDDSKDINDYAYQVAYCISHDWLKETATWDDVEKACKLGAEWNKRHHKSAWSDEDECYMAECINAIATKDGWSFEEKRKTKHWLKSVKDRIQPQLRQEWKQENTDDLTDFENAMMHIGESFFGKNAGLDPNDIDAIKEQANTLLGLVPSKEWSKEDESIALGIEQIVNCASLLNIAPDKLDKVRNWLKSLKQRYAWKPSDEQMRALEYIINNAHNTSYSCKIAKELLEQLRRLKGEEV